MLVTCKECRNAFELFIDDTTVMHDTPLTIHVNWDCLECGEQNKDMTITLIRRHKKDLTNEEK